MPSSFVDMNALAVSESSLLGEKVKTWWLPLMIIVRVASWLTTKFRRLMHLL